LRGDQLVVEIPQGEFLSPVFNLHFPFPVALMPTNAYRYTGAKEKRGETTLVDVPTASMHEYGRSERRQEHDPRRIIHRVTKSGRYKCHEVYKEWWRRLDQRTRIRATNNGLGTPQNKFEKRERKEGEKYGRREEKIHPCRYSPR